MRKERNADYLASKKEMRSLRNMSEASTEASTEDSDNASTIDSDTNVEKKAEKKAHRTPLRLAPDFQPQLPQDIWGQPVQMPKVNPKVKAPSTSHVPIPPQKCIDSTGPNQFGLSGGERLSDGFVLRKIKEA